MGVSLTLDQMAAGPSGSDADPTSLDYMASHPNTSSAAATLGGKAMAGLARAPGSLAAGIVPGAASIVDLAGGDPRPMMANVKNVVAGIKGTPQTPPPTGSLTAEATNAIAPLAAKVEAPGNAAAEYWEPQHPSPNVPGWAQRATEMGASLVGQAAIGGIAGKIGASTEAPPATLEEMATKPVTHPIEPTPPVNEPPPPAVPPNPAIERIRDLQKPAFPPGQTPRPNVDPFAPLEKPGGAWSPYRAEGQPLTLEQMATTPKQTPALAAAPETPESVPHDVPQPASDLGGARPVPPPASGGDIAPPGTGEGLGPSPRLGAPGAIPSQGGGPELAPPNPLVNTRPLNLTPEQATQLDQVTNDLVSGGFSKDYKSFTEQLSDAQDFARQVGQDPILVDPAKVKNLSGAQIQGLRTILKGQLDQMASLEKARNDPSISMADAENIDRELDKVTGDAHNFLQTIVKESGERGRDLGILRMQAASSLDADVWAVRASRAAGRDLTDDELSEIHGLAKAAQVVCG